HRTPGHTAEKQRTEPECLQRTARPGVELVEPVGGEADEQRAGERARAQQAVERDPDELQRSRRRAAAQVRAKAALGATPEIVSEPDRRNRGDRRLRQPDDDTEEGEPQAAVVDALRPAPEDEVDELPPAVSEALQVAAGR